MKTTKILLLLLTIFFSQAAMGDNEYLVVWQKSGNKVYYDLSENPVTTYSDGYLKITTSSMSVSYPLEDVLRYTYITNSTGIMQPEASVKVKQGRNSITFFNLKQDTKVNVYGTDGKLAKTVIVNSTETTVNLSELPLGVYVISANGATYKLARQ